MLATMCFFVLILSFAEFNVPKFKQITGSLNNAFGIQREIPIVEQPMGTTIISMTFSPSPAPSVTNEMTQQTTQVNQPELELQTKTKDSDDGDGKAQEIMEALEQAVAKGDIQVETLGEKLWSCVVVLTGPDDRSSSWDVVKESGRRD